MKILKVLLALLLLTGISLNAQNIYTASNAASPTNEANSTNGFSGAAAISTSTLTPQNGTWAIRVLTTAGGGRDARTSFNATVGTVYNISIWARRGNPNNNPAFANWTGVSGFATTTINSTTWTQYNFTVTATATSPVIVAYAGPIGSAGGMELFIDNIMITSQGGGGGDTQAPTAPSNLAASNVASTSLTLSWTGSTDNVGVVNYNIYRNGTLSGQTGNNSTTYNVVGLTASTSYSFYVRALDAAGNISNNSNTINVTTTSGGGGGGEPYTTLNANLSTVNWQANDLFVAGEMGIGTSPNANFQLSVNGDIRAKEVVVESGWSDFVFEKGYNLPSLNEVEQFINDNGHLKDIPSAAEVQQNGVGLAEINTLLLQKVEELTLYLIQMNKRLAKIEQKKALDSGLSDPK